MSVRPALAFVVLCSGCDLVFDLVEPVDASIDAAKPPDCPPRLADADEDGDMFPDSEDNCPSISQGDQADADSDGVGDACDARPGMPDRICFFGFHDASELASLDTMSKDWEVANDVVLQTVVKPRDALIVRPVFTSAFVIVQARGLTDARLGRSPRIGVIVSGGDLVTDMPTGIGCELEHRFSAAADARLFHLDTLDFQAMDVESADTTITLRLAAASATDGKPACDANHGGGVVNLTLPNFGPQTGQVGVYLDDATVEIRSILIISAAE